MRTHPTILASAAAVGRAATVVSAQRDGPAAPMTGLLLGAPWGAVAAVAAGALMLAVMTADALQTRS